MSYKVLSTPPERRIVVDAGYLAAGRHIIHGLLEIDVTLARRQLREASAQLGRRISFTAFVAASLARAVAEDPRVQAYADWRGRIVVFEDVDVAIVIEPEAGSVAFPHIIRNANRRTVLDISDEIRAIQASPSRSEQRNRMVMLAPHLPRWMRFAFYRIMFASPHRFRRYAGTVMITAIGMMGSGGGWGIAYLPFHTLGLTVGGITRKPGASGESIEMREYLDLTVSCDHDVVDGAPLARLSARLRNLIEQAALLDGI